MIEGDEKQIKNFIKDLEKALVEQFGNPTISFSQFQEDAQLEIPSLLRSSQSLMVGQLQKGIKVQLEILDSLNGLKEMTHNLPQEISKMLPKQISEELSKSLPQEISAAMTKTLPQEIARHLAPELAKAMKTV